MLKKYKVNFLFSLILNLLSIKIISFLLGFYLIAGFPRKDTYIMFSFLYCKTVFIGFLFNVFFFYSILCYFNISTKLKLFVHYIIFILMSIIKYNMFLHLINYEIFPRYLFKFFYYYL